MPRLVGKFRLEGSIERPGEPESSRHVSIHGRADCSTVRAPTLIVGLSTGVECLLEMTWAPSAADGTTAPDASPTRHSAVLMYAYDQSTFGVRHMMVDDQGVAEGGTAQLIDNTLVSDSPCARTKGNCASKVRITAGPDVQSVKMQMDMEVDGKRTGGHQLTLHRELATP